MENPCGKKLRGRSGERAKARDRRTSIPGAKDELAVQRPPQAVGEPRLIQPPQQLPERRAAPFPGDLSVEHRC